MRGRLSQIVYYRPDGRQIIFKKSDSDAYMEKFRVDPIDLDALVDKILAPRRRNQARSDHGRFKSSDGKKSAEKEKPR